MAARPLPSSSIVAGSGTSGPFGIAVPAPFAVNEVMYLQPHGSAAKVTVTAAVKLKSSVVIVAPLCGSVTVKVPVIVRVSVAVVPALIRSM